LLDYALFVAYFPHLIAGPLVRHNDLIPQFRQLLHPPDQARTPQVQQPLVGRVERVLILRPADPVFDRQVLYRLEEELDARHLLQPGPQPPDDVHGGRARAVLERLQRDLDTAAVHRRVDAVGADERGEVLHRRILANHRDQLLLQP
jgi:hypothetical protein